ncbi:MAG: hypothetical protein DCC66_08415 [Planctomycetota bacterium]|nr:MAG: hypothetical protein DCC66_08415 [Planctomycetota bacterium]
MVRSTVALPSEAKFNRAPQYSYARCSAGVNCIARNRESAPRRTVISAEGSSVGAGVGTAK